MHFKLVGELGLGWPTYHSAVQIMAQHNVLNISTLIHTIKRYLNMSTFGCVLESLPYQYWHDIGIVQHSTIKIQYTSFDHKIISTLWAQGAHICTLLHSIILYPPRSVNMSSLFLGFLCQLKLKLSYYQT